jgi:hypothetical protein
MRTEISKWFYLQRQDYPAMSICTGCGITISYPGVCYYCKQEWYHDEPIQENHSDSDPRRGLLDHIRRIDATTETIERWAILAVTAAWIIGLIWLLLTAGGNA